MSTTPVSYILVICNFCVLIYVTHLAITYLRVTSNRAKLFSLTTPEGLTAAKSVTKIAVILTAIAFANTYALIELHHRWAQFLALVPIVIFVFAGAVITLCIFISVYRDARHR